MGKEAKTNAMRMLERAKVNYTSHEYPHEEGQAVDGAHVAQLTGQDPAKVFKTLVTQGADRNYYVFVVPVLAELDLKKAAKSVGVKSVAMIHVADINKVTGYIRAKFYLVIIRIVVSWWHIRSGFTILIFVFFFYSLFIDV